MNAEAEVEPFLVEPGWGWCDIVPEALGPTYRLLHYPDGTTRFEHRCDRAERGVIICAPALRLGNGHTLTWSGAGDHSNPRGKPTVSPSILCPDCGLHGFVVDGWWRAA